MCDPRKRSQLQSFGGDVAAGGSTAPRDSSNAASSRCPHSKLAKPTGARLMTMSPCRCPTVSMSQRSDEAIKDAEAGSHWNASISSCKAALLRRAEARSRGGARGIPGLGWGGLGPLKPSDPTRTAQVLNQKLPDLVVFQPRRHGSTTVLLEGAGGGRQF